MEHTIAAISTPMGKGGVAMIRISGQDALNIADKVYKGKNKLSDAKTHTVHYGHIVYKNEVIDEVLVTVMRAPKTFTREDVVEVSTHGGVVTAKKVLDAIILSGARLAEPGEFTKRAFLNGRIDLSQAEAVIDVINAGNDLSRKNAITQLGGALSREIQELRSTLVHLAAQMQVIIDYPDEDLAEVDISDIERVCKSVREKTQQLIKSADNGAIIKDGIRATIVGKPNVGKSSLLNALARYDRAIVTDVAGTTRDIIEESINLNGVELILVDTAGIHDTDDAVEKIGVERSKQSLDNSDLVIVMLDGSYMLDDDDISIIKRTRDKKRIILINKNDIGKGKYTSSVIAKANGDPVIEISAKTLDGTDKVREEIRRLYNLGELTKDNSVIITNARHKAALVNADKALLRVLEGIELGMPSDIVSIDINEAISDLGEITGETVSDAIVQDIFHSFCVGK